MLMAARKPTCLCCRSKVESCVRVRPLKIAPYPVPIPRRPVLGGPEVVRVGLNTNHTSKTPRGEPMGSRDTHASRDTGRAHSPVTGHTDRESWNGTVLFRSGTPIHSTHSVVVVPESRASR